MENNKKREENEFNPLELCDAMYNVLEKLADSTGRQRCGYIVVMDNLIGTLKQGLLNSGPEIRIDLDAEKEKVEGEDNEG